MKFLIRGSMRPVKSQEVEQLKSACCKLGLTVRCADCRFRARWPKPLTNQKLPSNFPSDEE